MSGRKPYKRKYKHTVNKQFDDILKKSPERTLENETEDKQRYILRIVICLAVITLFLAAAFSVAVAVYIRDLKNLRHDRDSMRVTKLDVQHLSAFDAQMRESNPDYLCWIKIDSTVIDYPVVRGNDNEKYLHTSFYGEENIFGTLFMDYRCKGEYVPHIIIYGHNSRHGDMFGGLRNFLDRQYLAEHPTITLKVNERLVEYEIFDARKTDISDPAYNLDFSTSDSFSAFAEECGAPTDAAQIITLSTCVSGDNEDERVIVQGVLR